jgi:transposase
VDRGTTPQRSEATLKVRPIFLHNDDRIEALIAIIGIALLVYGLIEAELRQPWAPDTPLPGHRAAIPTSRAILVAFHGLHLTYTPTGPHLDHSRHSARPSA